MFQSLLHLASWPKRSLQNYIFMQVKNENYNRVAFHAHYAAMGMASATTCLHPKKHLQLLPLYRTNGLSFDSTQPLSASPKPNKLTIFVAAVQLCAPQDVEQYLSHLSMLQIDRVGNASQSSPC